MNWKLAILFCLTVVFVNVMSNLWVYHIMNKENKRQRIEIRTLKKENATIIHVVDSTFEAHGVKPILKIN